MKATNTVLTRLARLVRKDLASGRQSESAQQAVEALAGYENAALGLLELALKEDAKDKSDASLIQAYGFLFSQALENLRYEIEAGYRSASERVESARKRLVSARASASADAATLLFLVQCFGAAKLDLGGELAGVVAALGEDVATAGSAELSGANPADLLGFLAEALEQAGTDPFELFSAMAENSSGVPEEHRSVMATAFLLSGHETAVEASIGWLLDSAKEVRRSIANALEGAGRKGGVTPVMLRRMISMRNWLPVDSRAALDAAIVAARKKGISPAQWPDVEVRRLLLPGVDGSGAIGVLAHCRDKRQNVLGSLLLKHGFGVRDAWAQSKVKQKEIDLVYAELASMDHFAASADWIRVAVGHFLAVGHQTGLMPPFGLLRFLEAVGISSVQPGFLSAASLLDMLENGRAIGAEELEDLLERGSDLVDDYVFLDSWFEAGDEVEVLITSAASEEGDALIMRVMEKVLEPRRDWWAQLAAWSAYILYQTGEDERWHEFYAAASALLQGRPIHEIALMKTVAKQTVLASKLRRVAV
jgi:hypothetical protein